MKQKLFLTLFLCGICSLSFADDVLKTLMARGKTHLIENENFQAKTVLEKALALSIRQERLNEKAIICNNLGVVAWRIGRYKEGVEAYELALDTYRILGNDTLIAQSQYNLGLALKGLGNTQIAIKNFTAALKLFEKIQNEKQIAMVYDALGNIYKDLENHKKAIHYHTSAMAIYKKISYPKGISRSAHNLGQVYSDEGDLRKAKKYLFQAREIKKELNLSTASNDAQIGTYFIRANQLDSAEVYYTLSLNTRIREGNDANIATAYWHMGDLLVKQKKYQIARPALNKAYFLADSLDLNQLLIDILKSQIEIGTIYGEELNEKYEQLILLKDAVLGEKSRKAVARFEVEYGVLKKDQEIDLKNSQLLLQQAENEKLSLRNTILISSILGAAVFVFMVIYFYVKLRLRKKETEHKNELLTNSYEVIDNLHKELSHRTKNYFQMFSGMLKYDQEQTSNETVSILLDKYLSRVEAMSQIQRYLLKEKNASKEVQLNLYLEELLANINLLLNNRETNVSISANFDPVLCDYDIALRIGLVMNEIISNSFEHGFEAIDEPMLDLHLSENEYQQVTLSIVDNGVGINDDQTPGDSMGIVLMKMILKSVKGTLIFERNKKMGTSVLLECPHTR